MSIPKFSETRSDAIRDGLVAEVEGRPRRARRGWMNVAVFALSGALVGGAVSGAAWASRGDGPTERAASPVASVPDNTGVPAPVGVIPGQPIVSLLAGGGSVVVAESRSIAFEDLPDAATHVRVTVSCASAGSLSWGLDAAGNNPSISCNPVDVDQRRGTAWYDFDLAGGTTLYLTPTRGTYAVSWQYLNLVETAWGVNANGETFGTSKDDGRTPDLIAVALPGGDVDEYGYSRVSEMDGPMPSTPEEAAALEHGPREVPIYESDGVTQIGVFPIG